MTKEFKSNIKCGACVEKVSEALNTMDSISSWEVNLEHKDRILRVDGDADAEAINERLKPLGYQVSE